LLNTEEEKIKRIKDLEKSFITKDYSNIEKNAIKVIEIAPNELIGWKRLAASQYRLHKFDKSLNSFKKAYKLGDVSDISLNNIGTCLLSLNRSDEALKYFIKALKVNPSLAIAYFNCGNIYRDLFDFNKAYSSFKKASELDNKNKVFFYNFGLICSLLSKKEEALKAFQKSLYLDKEFYLALISIGYIHLQDGKIKEAENYFLKANEINPNNPIITNLLGNVYNNLGNNKLSLDYFLTSNDLLDEEIKTCSGSKRESLLKLRQGINTNIGNQYISQGNFYDGFINLSKGTGYFSISDNIKNISIDNLPKSKKINSNYKPHFIGMWEMDNINICNDIIKIFNKRIDRQVKGEFGGTIQLDRKDTVDISVDMKEIFEKGDFSIVKIYIDFLLKCYKQYSQEWPFLKNFRDIKIGRFNFQKYDTNKHFKYIHSERMSLNESHRLFAFMTYLNEVEEGGETRFEHFGINVLPKVGRTLIWPAEWTHAHSGGIVKKGEKYISTGWFEIHS
jgi:prolyl 4-hydroxylase